MKKNIFWLVVCYFFVACTSALGKKAVQFEYLTLEKKQDCISAKTTYIYIEDQKSFPVLKKMQENIDRILLSNEPSVTSVHEDLEKFVESGLDCLKDLPGAQSCCYHAEKTVRIVRKSQGIFSGEVAQYIYTGGAHGNNVLTYFNFDSETGLSFTLNDLVQDTTTLKNMVYDAILKQVDLGYLFVPEDSFVDLDESRNNTNDNLSEKIDKNNFELEQERFFNEVFYLTENFLISTEGLVFAYQPYEIAPYSTGIIQVVLPFSEIQFLLKRNLDL